MKKILTIVGICYSLYAAAIITFIFSRIDSALKLIALDAGEGAFKFSQSLPILTVGAIGTLLAFLTFILSILLIRRKRRKICLILAGIFLVEIPFGTILGVFAIIILTSPIIKQEFES